MCNYQLDQRRTVMKSPILAPWWQSEELTSDQSQLLSALLEAHHAIALRGAPAVTLAAQGSGIYQQAVAAALMTLGDKSGPVEEAYRFLGSKAIGTTKLQQYVANGGRVPGWGSQQIKAKPDPAWDATEALLEAHWPQIHKKLEDVTAAFHACGKRLYPNAAAYSAAVTEALGIPGDSVAYLWVLGRIGAWSAIFNRNKLWAF